MMDTLIYIMEHKDKLKIISDLAFEAVDDDLSGQLDMDELATVLRDTANAMKISPPTENDILAVLDELDQDNDRQVSKDEFQFLVVKVLEKMIESEMNLNKAYLR